MRIISTPNRHWLKRISQLEKELSEAQQKNAELLQRVELESNIISIVSHELRTPLTYIKEGISQVVDGIVGEINDDQREFLMISLEGIERLTAIINNLLDSAKLDSGKVELRKSFFDVTDLIKKINAEFLSLFHKKDLTLESILPANQISLFADYEKIIQVLTNLISNAYKFTEQGGVTIIVTPTETEIKICVADTGVGINKQNLTTIFEKFVQVNRTHGPGIKGTGLGLSISRSLIEMHGGRLWVESEPGKGSQFYFTLPLLKEEVIIKELINNEIKDAADNSGTFSLIVLLIEDYQKLHEIIKLNPDQILIDIETIVKKNLRRSNDKIYSHQGICYLFLPDTKWKGILALASRFREDVVDYLDNFQKENGQPLKIKFGSAIFPFDGDTSEMLLTRAIASLNDLYLGIERRKDNRVPARIIIHGGLEENRKTIDFQTANISEGGLCIASKRYIKLPEYNQIVMPLPAKYGTIKVKAVFIWMAKKEETNEYLYGLKFVSLSETDKKKLKTFLEA